MLYPGHSLLSGSLSVLDWRGLCDMIEHQTSAVVIASRIRPVAWEDEVEVELTGSLRQEGVQNGDKNRESASWGACWRARVAGGCWCD